MHLPNLRRSLGLLLLLASVYALMLLRWGYEFGRNDQMQTLAYTEFLADPADWPQDFYLQGIHERVPNERFVFSALWTPFAGHLDTLSLVGHALFSLLLLHALWSLAGLWIRSPLLRLALPLLLFIPLYGISLGGNELWYNSFFVSNVVKVIGLYALLGLLRGHRVWAFAAAGGVTLLQPVVGLHLFGLFLGASLWEGIRRKAKPGFWRSLGTGALLWFLSGGLWVLFLKLHFEEEALQGPDRFFEILYVFRAPHHYWPPAWSLKDWVLEGGLLLFGLIWFSFQARHPAPPGEHQTRRALRIQGAFIAGLLAALAYAVAMPAFSPVWLGAVQGFKSTIFLEALAVLALLAAVQDLLPFLERTVWKRLGMGLLLLAGLLGGTALVLVPERIPIDVPHDYRVAEVPQNHWDEARDIAVQIRDNIPRDALFAHPIGFTELKFHGRRSAFVDYKVLVHTRAAMHEWARRIELLYGLSPEGQQWLQDIGHPLAADYYTLANHYFSEATPSMLQQWATEGITHLLIFRDAPAAQHLDAMGQSPIVQNAGYAVYALP